MNLLFTPNHVQLLNSCYPPTSALLTAGPDYSPNSQELSRLTYYASNHPAKLSKLGTELEKQVRSDARKARAGNLRARSSLLVALAILRALALECRRDIAYLSPSLVASVEVSITSLPADIEVTARAATLFTAWTTFTDGHLIGADSSLTRAYLSVLKCFCSLSCQDGKDAEAQNKTRLVGFAALTGAINSEALYNDTVQFKAQVSIIMRPILFNLLQAPLEMIEKQAHGVRDAPISPFLAEFRTRPALERRAASIHIHVDGDVGPSMSEVSSACLRALFCLLQHVSGAQLGYIMLSSLENLEYLNAWSFLEHCCWIAQKAAEWAQYQYRYAISTCLIERLLYGPDSLESLPMQKALVTMATTVFNSPIPLINLSTSDILTNLLTVLIRKITINCEDPLLPDLIKCIASLGSHVYYSDQIQDLASELINRLINVELHGIVPRSNAAFNQTRSQALRCLIASLVGLIRAADENNTQHSTFTDVRKRSLSFSRKPTPPEEGSPKESMHNERVSRRTRVSPDMWQDTLSLLCDPDYAVRADYAEALIFYLEQEMPKHGDGCEANGVITPLGRLDSPMQQAINVNAILHAGDLGTKFLHATHSFVYLLATSATFGLPPSITAASSMSSQKNGNIPQVQIQPATPAAESRSSSLNGGPSLSGRSPSHNNDRRSFSLSLSQPLRTRKISSAFRLLKNAPPRVTSSAAATLNDYVYVCKILSVIHKELPIRGLLTGMPMLLTLDEASRPQSDDDAILFQRLVSIRIVLSKVWIVVGKIWECPELTALEEKAISSIPESCQLPELPIHEGGVYHPPSQPKSFPSDVTAPFEWDDITAGEILPIITASSNIQRATGLDPSGLARKFGAGWNAHSALKESFEKSSFDSTIRGDGISPLLKISPALMKIDNASLQSLSRSQKGVGVMDLRDALQGRSNMSTSALASGAGSISTLDQASSGGDSHGLTPTRSRTKPKKLAMRPGSNQVGDVLNRLGIGKQNGSHLKSSFPASPKLEQR